MRRRYKPLALSLPIIFLATAEQQARYALTLQRIQRASEGARAALTQLGIEVPHA